jgi:uncharacterized protein (TIGR03437 family)
MRINKIGFLLSSLIAVSATASAQDNAPWDSSGNSMLAGAYNFRQVLLVVGDGFGDINNANTVYGTITFDGLQDASGNGHYTLNSSLFQSSVGVLQSYSITGTYRISASGLGFLSNTLNTGVASPKIWGTVSQGGIFIGSSTEDTVNDMFVAAKAPSTAPNAAGFNGSYTIVEMNYPSLDPTQARDAMFQINPNGAGSLGALNVSGYIGGLNTNIVQSIPVATYSFNANGLGTLVYGGTLTNANLVAGSWLFYMSPDKRFIFGGSIAGFDLFVGVLNPATTTAPPNLLSGLYYQAGLDEDLTLSGSGFANMESDFGAFQATAGTIIGHQRLLNSFNPNVVYNAFDYTYSDTFSVNPDGTMDDRFGQHHAVASGGDIRVGIGTGVIPGISVALRAPVFSGSGVFLSPTGITNWFSSAPFTVGMSPGAFLALSGTGLANVNMTDPTLPFILGNVQVVVNDRAAPIYQVSPNLIIIAVPYATPTTGAPATIKVINNGVASAIRTVFSTTTTPGVLADGGGAGHVIAQHLDYSLVTPSHPALPGEIILFYVEGLGTVSPAVADGVPAPLSPLSPVVATLGVRVDGENTTLLFSGLTPTLIADYAVIAVIPADILPGDRRVSVSGPDSNTDEATIPVGGTSSAQISLDTTTAVVTDAAIASAPKTSKPRRAAPDSPQAIPLPTVVIPWDGVPPDQSNGR